MADVASYSGYVVWMREMRNNKVEVLTAVKMSIVVFWVVASSYGLVCRWLPRFRRNFTLKVEGTRSSETLVTTYEATAKEIQKFGGEPLGE
jgi:hypothetical protein